ncbi:P-loop containing nucleoside triphosphate hydrolase protein [Clavulina sp. PMI_390]|nr:P-loop containing nucleoside triphosphate hydrolase protein [Clavulina sp. PMI_390]
MPVEMVVSTIFSAVTTSHNLWADSRTIPVYLAVVSFLLVASTTISHLRRTSLDKVELEPSNIITRVWWIIKTHGVTLFLLRALRLGSCIVLLFLNIISTVNSTGVSGTTEPYYRAITLAETIFFVYAAALSFGTLAFRVQERHVAVRHVIVLFLAEFGVYFYRDIYPLCTYTKEPMDITEGKLLWVRLGLLALVSLVIPFVAPREYNPIDPENPNEPNPEQLASTASLISFSFMSSLIATSSKNPHIPFDLLPTLGDRDRAAYLNEFSRDYVRPSVAKRRGSFRWRLLTMWWRRFAVMFGWTFSRAVWAFLVPMSLNQILRIIETKGKGATLRPWVWIIVFFIAPVLSTVSFQMHIYNSAHLVVQMESILTQAIFEHALRIRMKTTPSDDSKAVKGAKGGKANNLEGKINNLISSDVGYIAQSWEVISTVFSLPFQATFSIGFLYTLLGWSALVGLAILLLGMYVPGKIAQRIHAVQVLQSKATDARVQTVTETLGVIRLIKMFGYESKIQAEISEKRKAEVDLVKRRYYIRTVNEVYNQLSSRPFATTCSPHITSVLVTFFTYTYVMGKPLTASTVFSSIAVFETLRNELNRFNEWVPSFIAATVSMDRLDDFLYNTEVLDRFVEDDRDNLEGFLPPVADPEVLGFHNATFAWDSSSDFADSSTSVALPGTPSTSSSSNWRNFRLQIPGDLQFKQGVLNLILGPTGSGKTSMLLALLGEMHAIHTGPDSWYNLPRKNGVAYASQSPWILNRTIKDNILFGEEYDAARYQAEHPQYFLNARLSPIWHFSRLEIRPKYDSLSASYDDILTPHATFLVGGRERADLEAQVVLLDDILSALDVHTARSVAENCLAGEVLRGRTVILVTHNVALTAKFARFFVTIAADGSISGSDSFAGALKNPDVQEELEEDKLAIQKANQVIDDSLSPSTKPEAPKANGKLVVAEEVKVGRVTGRAVLLFLSSMGNPVFWITWWGLNLVNETFLVFLSWWLGQWALAYEQADDPSEVSVPHYMTRYVLLILVCLGIYVCLWANMIFGVTRAATRIHNRLVHSILGTTLRFLDTTPVGRIVSRFTQDIQTVDTTLSAHVRNISALTSAIILKLGTVVFFSPIYIFPGMALAGVAFIIGRVYMKAQLSVKRERSNRRSPVFSTFGTAISGLTSIRAYSAETAFQKELLELVDAYTRASRAFFNLNRWMGVRIDFLGAIFTTSLVIHLVYFSTSTNASIAGLQLSQAVVFSSILLWWVRFMNEAEISAISLERIQQYLDIEHEAPPSAGGVPPAAWPTSGDIVVKDLSARYSTDGPEVLHKLSFTIKSGEKIGVVGRTGSGKSSLTLSLLRLIPTDGNVLYDGRNTRSVNLEELRKSVTIIPQQPELLSGTIRQNLDPFGAHDDAALNDALRSAGLFSLQAELPEDQRITLDSKVGSGGGNFSVGQRQIIALARALVRRSKLLILDEATASLDHATDNLVQETLKTEFSDVTLITVAHRLETVMNADKIMVLDAGNIAQYDSPRNLLAADGGSFKSLVDGSGDRERLYELVNLGASPSLTLKPTRLLPWTMNSESVPVIDLSDSSPTFDISGAIKDLGFLALKSPQEPSTAQVVELFSIAEDFFLNESLAEKERCGITVENKGWVKKGQEMVFNIAMFSQTGEPTQPLPARLAQHTPTLAAFAKSCHVLCMTLLEAFSVDMNLPKDYFTSRHNFEEANRSILRLLYYPPVEDLPGDVSQSTAPDIRAGAHSDYGTLTLLFQAHPELMNFYIAQKSVGGLQILMPGASPDEQPRWLDAPVIPESVLVNIGDSFDFWTGGRFPSTQHRVVSPRNADEAVARFSIAFFLYVLSHPFACKNEAE